MFLPFSLLTALSPSVPFSLSFLPFAFQLLLLNQERDSPAPDACPPEERELTSEAHLPLNCNCVDVPLQQVPARDSRDLAGTRFQVHLQQSPGCGSMLALKADPLMACKSLSGGVSRTCHIHFRADVKDRPMRCKLLSVATGMDEMPTSEVRVFPARIKYLLVGLWAFLVGCPDAHVSSPRGSLSRDSLPLTTPIQPEAPHSLSSLLLQARGEVPPSGCPGCERCPCLEDIGVERHTKTPSSRQSRGRRSLTGEGQKPHELIRWT